MVWPSYWGFLKDKIVGSIKDSLDGQLKAALKGVPATTLLRHRPCDADQRLAWARLVRPDTRLLPSRRTTPGWVAEGLSVLSTYSLLG